MNLTDRAITNLKPTGKSSKHFDGGGLYLFLSPTGRKLWRLVYRFERREKAGHAFYSVSRIVIA